ncbi:MAG: PASTA domain-containing protein [Flavobacteriaceae bacterium]
MLLIRFLFSKFFIKQLGLALIIVVLLVSGSIYGLRKYTHHNEFKTVPDLKGVPFMIVEEILTPENLRFAILDSSKYNPDMPPLAVLEQSPKAGNLVKDRRKIYLTVNPSGYRKIKIPNVIQITKRNAESTLKAVGFEVGKITYRNNIGKDMVLEIRHNGKKIEPGVKLPKTTTIDLVLGNGKSY